MCLTLCAHGLYWRWDSPSQNTGVGSLSFPQGIEPRSPVLQVDSLPAEPPGKPKNAGVGSLYLLQQIVPLRNRTGVSSIAGVFFFFFFLQVYSLPTELSGKVLLITVKK